MSTYVWRTENDYARAEAEPPAPSVAHIACEQTYSGTRGTVTVWCYCGHSAEGIDLHDAKRKHVLHLDGINVSA